jgi:uncharacterized protein (TIGR02271 family)
MAIVAYSKQNEFDLVHTGQDCRGWTVTDQAGNNIGTVTELLLNTDAGLVDSIIVEGGTRIPAGDIALQNNRVVVRGVLQGEQYEQTRRAVTENPATATANSAPPNYAEMHGDASDKSTFVPGVTREATENDTVVPIIEEQLRVGKRTVEQGGAHVRTHIAETPVEQQVNLREEHIVVDRKQVNRPATAADFRAFQEGEIEISERAEVPIIAKEARVVEEVTIGKEVVEHQEAIQTTLRETEVEVERLEEDVYVDGKRVTRTANP